VICAYFEAVQLAGFSEREAKRYFGAPPRGVALRLAPKSTAEVQAAFLARFDTLIEKV
jgi:hypothetical protein